MALLELKGVSLSYDDRRVVNGLSFSISQGELIGLIGPNGCGKTSIIKAISRIMPIASGEVLLGGKNIDSISRGEMARLVGVVPQNPALPDTFSVFEVVVMGRNPHLGLLRGESPRDLAIAWKAMQSTGIESLAGRRMGELSGGEKQRVTIARVLTQEPKLVLLDEPTANLDISHQIDVLDLIKRLCLEKKLAVLVALHDLNLATQYCDRLLLMKDGRIFAKGAPSDVVTSENIKAVYGAESCVYPHPANHLPVVLPRGDYSKLARD